jgi:hypothetical protein
MFNEIQHPYSVFKDNELFWLPSDDAVSYQKNLEVNNDKLREYNWIDKTFTYKFNSHGFRCEEFSNEDSIMFLGCSHTAGIGLPLEDTWAYQVAKRLNLKCVNLSIGGIGPDMAFRLANHYIPQIKPKLVVYYEPPPGRFYLYSSNEKFYYFNSGCMEMTHPMFLKFYQHWLSLEENIELDLLKHKLAIQALCQQNNIKFIFSKHELHFIDYARDLIHAGVNANKDLAELILNRINQNS